MTGDGAFLPSDETAVSCLPHNIICHLSFISPALTDIADPRLVTRLTHIVTQYSKYSIKEARV